MISHRKKQHGRLTTHRLNRHALFFILLLALPRIIFGDQTVPPLFYTSFQTILLCLNIAHQINNNRKADPLIQQSRFKNLDQMIPEDSHPKHYAIRQITVYTTYQLQQQGLQQIDKTPGSSRCAICGNEIHSEERSVMLPTSQFCHIKCILATLNSESLLLTEVPNVKSYRERYHKAMVLMVKETSNKLECSLQKKKEDIKIVELNKIISQFQWLESLPLLDSLIEAVRIGLQQAKNLKKSLLEKYPYNEFEFNHLEFAMAEKVFKEQLEPMSELDLLMLTDTIATFQGLLYARYCREACGAYIEKLYPLKNEIIIFQKNISKKEQEALKKRLSGFDWQSSVCDALLLQMLFTEAINAISHYTRQLLPAEKELLIQAITEFKTIDFMTLCQIDPVIIERMHQLMESYPCLE